MIVVFEDRKEAEYSTIYDQNNEQNVIEVYAPIDLKGNNAHIISNFSSHIGDKNMN